jgi:hypothetical protein
MKMLSEVTRVTSRKTRLISAVSVTALALGLFGAMPAQATTEVTELPPEAVSELTRVWTANGVPSPTQTQLITKLESGTPLDEMTDAAPISTKTRLVGSTQKSVSTYADGSISVVSVESSKTRPKDFLSTQAVAGCTNTTIGAGVVRHANCTVNGWFTGVSLGFYATVTTATVEGSYINTYNSPTVKCVVGLSCTAPTFELIRKTQSGSLPAQVNLVTYWSGAGTGTTRLSLYVKSTSIYTN